MLKINTNNILKNPKFYLFLILFVSFFSKLFNLNYNSPSSDEAVYIAFGHSILSKWNWGIYNSASWVGGHTYFYPILSSIAYYYNGIIGSRLVNIIFLSLTSYFTYLLVNKISFRLFGGLHKNRISLISLFSSLVVSFSAVSIYISRLATYDMPSFSMLIVGLYYLVLSSDNKFDDQGKATNFFLAAIFLSISFAFKYISLIYLPIIVFVSYLFINNNFKKSLMHFWRFYFLTPVIILLLVVSLTQYQYLKVFITSQIEREQFDAIYILTEFLKNSYYLIPYLIIGSTGLVIKKHWKMLASEVVLIATVIVFHIMFNRVSALDKHVFFIMLITAIYGSVGIYELLKRKYLRYIIYTFMIIYVPFNIYISQRFNSLWPNYNTGISYLQDNMSTGNKLLSENGASIILTTFDNLELDNVITFDWFEYKGKTGEEAYKTALFEGYFKFIELENDTYSKPLAYKYLNEVVRNNLNDNYTLVLENKDYRIYKRDF